MSGIFGIHYLNDRLVKPEVLQQMSELLAHRGVDGANVWCRGNIGLGHRLLWTTPESLLEMQPSIEEENNVLKSYWVILLLLSGIDLNSNYFVLEIILVLSLFTTMHQKMYLLLPAKLKQFCVSQKYLK